MDVGALAALEAAGRAVPLHTGGDAARGRAAYATDAPYLTEAGAGWLAGHSAWLVGIDSVSINDIQAGGRRPAHSILLQAGIPVLEHLTGPGQLPPAGFRFTAAPIPLAAVASFPARAYATIPSHDIPGRHRRKTRQDGTARPGTGNPQHPCAETSNPGGPEPTLPAPPCRADRRISRAGCSQRSQCYRCSEGSWPDC